MTAYEYAASDNLPDAIEKAEELVKWVRAHKGADAHIVYDYLPTYGTDGAIVGYAPGTIRGVTVQWDHDDDGQPDIAVHAQPGSTVLWSDGAFDVQELEQ